MNEIETDMYIEEFNLKILKEFSNSDKKIMTETLYVLKETLIEDVEKMTVHFKDLDVIKLKSLAHKIKPNFQLIGLDSLYNVCDSIENKELNDDHLICLVKVIINSLPSVVDRIKIELN